MGKVVTDPAILALLNGTTSKTVTDPGLLAQLNAGPPKLGDAPEPFPGSPADIEQQKNSRPLSEAYKEDSLIDAVVPPQFRDVGTSLITTIPETAAAVGSGLGASAVGGLKGLTLGENDPDKTANIIRDFVEKYTYQPQTRAAQETMGLLSAPGQASNAVGEKVAEVTGSPAIGAGANMFLQALGGRAIAPEIGGSAKPVIALKHTAEMGEHTVISPNGIATAVENPRTNTLQVKRNDTTPGAEGKGEGTARIVKLAKEADAAGKSLESDISVSPAEVHIWENKLPEAGFTTIKNPHEVNPNTGNLVSADPKKGVFEVKPLPGKAKSMDFTPAEARAAHVKTLLINDVRLTTEQRGTSFASKQAGSLGRAADTLLGDSNVKAAQRQDFTTAVLKKAGLDAKNATPDAMSALHDQVQSKYNDLTGRVDTKLDKQLTQDWSDIASDAEAVLNADQLAPIKKQLENLQSKSVAGPGGPAIPGRTAQTIRSQLGLMKGNRDSGVVHFADRLQNALDDAFERSASPEDAAKMADAREQFHRMKQVEDAVAGDPNGQISPSKLVTVMSRKRNRGEAVYGKGDQELIELAKAGKEILPEKTGNSGTASRVTDIAKIGAAFTHPILAAKVAGSILGGRLLNEGRTTRGTATAVRNAEAGKGIRNLRAEALRRGTKAGAVTTPQERKRQLQAEALRQ